jgi:DNA-binding response OmpR family regulator
MHILVVVPGVGVPDARPAAVRDLVEVFELLGHTVQVWHGDPAACGSRGVADVLVVDARSRTRAAHRFLEQHCGTNDPAPILMIVRATDLSLVTAQWRVRNLVVDGCSLNELQARLTLAAEGRRNRLAASHRFGSVTLVDQDLTMCVGGRAIEFTLSEYCMLKLLISRAHRVVRSAELADCTPREGGGMSRRAVSMTVSRIRRKLGDEVGQIRAIRNVGYMFVSAMKRDPAPSGRSRRERLRPDASPAPRGVGASGSVIARSRLIARGISPSSGLRTRLGKPPQNCVDPCSV